jgi:hypothetical protein
MLCWTGWPSTITDDCTRLWVTSVRCNMSNAGMRHSVKKLHKSGAKNCSTQGQGQIWSHAKEVQRRNRAVEARKSKKVA